MGQTGHISDPVTVPPEDWTEGIGVSDDPNDREKDPPTQRSQ